MSVSPRIDGIVAAKAPVAVIFRRGPSNLCQQLVWRLDTDEVIPGQWLRGRVYTRRCDLSPDGKLLVGAFTNYSTRTEHRAKLAKDGFSHCGWTAVSRPPYFTAIALWFMGGAWNGGGIWTGPRKLAVNNFSRFWEEAIAPPKGLKVRHLDLGRSEDEPIYSELLRKRGWTQVQVYQARITNPGWESSRNEAIQMIRDGTKRSNINQFLNLAEAGTPRYEMTDPGRWNKTFANGSLVRIEGQRDETWSIHANDGRTVREFHVPMFQAQFLDMDHRGRVIFAEQGCLWAWEDCPNGEPKLVADLRENKFELVSPPTWAQTL